MHDICQKKKSKFPVIRRCGHFSVENFFHIRAELIEVVLPLLIYSKQKIREISQHAGNELSYAEEASGCE